MTIRHNVIAWVVAFLILIPLVGIALQFTPKTNHAFRGVDVAIVGSSLVRFGFPERGEGDSGIFLNGYSHQRIGMPNISDADLISTAMSAVGDGISVLFIEINPLIRDFAGIATRSSCVDWSVRFRKSLKAFQTNVMTGARVMVGKTVPFEPQEPDFSIFKGEALDPKLIDWLYPLRIHEPYCRQELSELVVAARLQKTKIVFIFPPRSISGERLIGERQSRELFEMAQSVSRDLNIPLFSTSGPWPDNEFVDHAHVNQLGRDRFVRELQLWWQSQQ